jgi:hypothetical protein
MSPANFIESESEPKLEADSQHNVEMSWLAGHHAHFVSFFAFIGLHINGGTAVPAIGPTIAAKKNGGFRL